jgi:hypothetical protein
MPAHYAGDATDAHELVEIDIDQIVALEPDGAWTQIDGDLYFIQRKGIRYLDAGLRVGQITVEAAHEIWPN